MITRDDVRTVFGTDVYSSDGHKIGSAGQVYLDNASGEPAWVSVRTGLFGKKESFVPLRDATLTDDRLEVPFDKEQVKNAPRVDQHGELSPAEEDELYRYYEPAADEGGEPGDNAVAAVPSRATDRDDVGGDAMTRSEERLVPGTRTETVGKARLRKYVVTEEQQVTVPVSREEVRLEHEPAGDDAGRPGDDPAVRDDDEAVTLRAERPVVTTETVPVERVRLAKETVTREETVSGEVRKERIALEDDSGRSPETR